MIDKLIITFLFVILFVCVIWQMRKYEIAAKKKQRQKQLEIPMRIILSESDFKNLVEGRTIVIDNAALVALSDIGYNKMGEILTQAWADSKLKNGQKD